MLAAEDLTSSVDFVGSMTNNPQGCTSATGNFDTGHEGHSGWQAVDIANQYIEGWVADAKPDIANFMLGTNDVNMGRSLEQILAAYDTMLEAMRAVNPNIKIIVRPPLLALFSVSRLPSPPLPPPSPFTASHPHNKPNKPQVDKLIPLPFNNGPVQALNAEIPAWAERHNSTESPIVVADCSEDNGYTAQMLRDGVHPDDVGDRLIADQIGPLLVRYVRDLIAEREA